ARGSAGPPGVRAHLEPGAGGRLVARERAGPLHRGDPASTIPEDRGRGCYGLTRAPRPSDKIGHSRCGWGRQPPAAPAISEAAALLASSAAFASPFTRTTTLAPSRSISSCTARPLGSCKPASLA